MGEQPWLVAGGTVLSPPLAFSAKLVDEQLERNPGKLVAEQLKQQVVVVVVVVGNTRWCPRLATSLTHGTAPAQSNANNQQQ